MTELRAWALGLVQGTTLQDKLRALPEPWSDAHPGESKRILNPGREPRLQIQPGRSVRVPPIQGMGDPAQRARILHAFANHELQAAELFAWAILAFADAAPAFRRGLASIAGDEQRHCRLYIARVEALGSHFGAYGLTGHFWNKLDAMDTPLKFVCAMGLTFENANLDFAIEYAAAARKAGDEETALALKHVHDDEVRHVGFAWRWLQKFRPADESCWKTYLASTQWPLGPSRARGRSFAEKSRRLAGLDDEFITGLYEAAPKRPSGEPR